jgi:hypothetical protein
VNKAPCSNANEEAKRNFWIGNFKAMTEELSRVNRPEVIGNGPAGEMLTGFGDLLRTLVDQYILLYTKVKKRKTRTISKKNY